MIQGTPFAYGYLPTAQDILYTSPADTKSYLKFMRVVNTNPIQDITANVWYQSEDTNNPAFLLTPPDMIILAGRMEEVVDKGEVMVLGPGDMILGDCSDTNGASYVMGGAIEI